MTKEQAVVIFLERLRDSRQLNRKLFELAEEQPQVVLDYIATLPDNWHRLDNDITDLLIRIEKVAQNSLKTTKPPI